MCTQISHPLNLCLNEIRNLQTLHYNNNNTHMLDSANDSIFRKFSCDGQNNSDVLHSETSVCSGSVFWNVSYMSPGISRHPCMSHRLYCHYIYQLVRSCFFAHMASCGGICCLMSAMPQTPGTILRAECNAS